MAGDFKTGPGDGLADALNDPCLANLFRSEGGDGAGEGVGLKDSDLEKVRDTLRIVGSLSEWMRVKAVALLEDESKGGGGDGGGGGGGDGEDVLSAGGSCAFNLTLINRMECSSAKRDLKPEPMFDMGKCSVSWHADSCLQDFSTIGDIVRLLFILLYGQTVAVYPRNVFDDEAKAWCCFAKVGEKHVYDVMRSMILSSSPGSRRASRSGRE